MAGLEDIYQSATGEIKECKKIYDGEDLGKNTFGCISFDGENILSVMVDCGLRKMTENGKILSERPLDLLFKGLDDYLENCCNGSTETFSCDSDGNQLWMALNEGTRMEKQDGSLDDYIFQTFVVRLDQDKDKVEVFLHEEDDYDNDKRLLVDENHLYTISTHTLGGNILKFLKFPKP